MTIKEIERMASGDYFMIRLDQINAIKRDMVNMTEFEQKSAMKRIKELAREIKSGLAISD